MRRRAFIYRIWFWWCLIDGKRDCCWLQTPVALRSRPSDGWSISCISIILVFQNVIHLTNLLISDHLLGSIRKVILIYSHAPFSSPSPVAPLQLCNSPRQAPSLQTVGLRCRGWGMASPEPLPCGLVAQQEALLEEIKAFPACQTSDPSSRLQHLPSEQRLEARGLCQLAYLSDRI